MTPVPDKPALRARLRSLRRRLSRELPDAAVRAAAQLPLGRLPPFETFSVYYPVGAELDPRPLMRRLAERGAATALPAAAHDGATMEFRRWSPGDRLKADAFRVPAPLPGAAVVRPELVVTPLVGFDRRGHRLGQGAGHYDRAIEALRAQKPVFVLGLAYAGQEVAELPDEPHDQLLDAILTETGYLQFG